MRLGCTTGLPAFGDIEELLASKERHPQLRSCAAVVWQIGLRVRTENCIAEDGKWDVAGIYFENSIALTLIAPPRQGSP
jgi:hypothetical protein